MIKGLIPDSPRINVVQQCPRLNAVPLHQKLVTVVEGQRRSDEGRDIPTEDGSRIGRCPTEGAGGTEVVTAAVGVQTVHKGV